MRLPKAKQLNSGKWRIQIQIDGRRFSVTRNTKKEVQDATNAPECLSAYNQ